MARNEVTKKKKNNAAITVLVLFVICIILLALVIFFAFGAKNISGSGKFLKETYNLQNKIALYIGKASSDAFGVYTNEEIITGKVSTTNEEIKDNSDETLEPLVNIDEKIEENGKIAYKINAENLEKLLNINMPSFSGIEFYLQDGEDLKVKLTDKPNWWSTDLDFLLVGKN